jgi:hypothetical protein
MSYQLRRIRPRGLIERLEGTHRYRLPEYGTRKALFHVCGHSRVIRPLFAALSSPAHSLQQRILCQVRALP